MDFVSRLADRPDLLLLIILAGLFLFLIVLTIVAIFASGGA